jgi:hypothetical protein
LKSSICRPTDRGERSDRSSKKGAVPALP